MKNVESRKKMKKKLLVTLLLLTMGITVMGCSSNEETSTSNKKEATDVSNDDDSKDEDSKDDDSNADTFSGDWEKEEASGYTPFFLKYGLADLEEKNTDDILLDNTFTFAELTDITQVLKNYTYFELTDEFLHDVGSFNSCDDLLNFDGATVYKDNGYITLTCYKEMPADLKNSLGDRNLVLTIYNPTGEELTFNEAIKQNSFSLGLYQDSQYDGFANRFFNISPDATKEEMRPVFAEIVDLVGKPSHIYKLHSDGGFARDDDDESFEETTQLGGGSILYSCVYEKENYTFALLITEMNIYDYSGEIDLSVSVNKTDDSKYYVPENEYKVSE